MSSHDSTWSNCRATCSASGMAEQLGAVGGEQVPGDRDRLTIAIGRDPLAAQHDAQRNSQCVGFVRVEPGYSKQSPQGDRA